MLLALLGKRYKNEGISVLGNLSLPVTVKRELQLHSLKRIQSRQLFSSGLNPQRSTSECFLLLVERKGSSHIPFPAVACVMQRHVSSGTHVQKHICAEEKYLFQNIKLKQVFFFQQNLQAITHHIQNITGAVEIKESAQKHCSTGKCKMA